MAKKSKAGTADELAAMLPGTREIAVQVRRAGSKIYDADSVTVTEMTIMQIAQVIRALSPIREAIAANPSTWEVAAEYPTEACAAVGVAIEWPCEKVARMGARSFDLVLAAVLEINRDFFALLLARLVSGVMAMPTPGAGERPSPTSVGTAGSSSLN